MLARFLTPPTGYLLFILFVWLGIGSVWARPLDFDPIAETVRSAPLAEPVMITSYDGTPIAVRQYLPRDAKAVLVFVHAGGLHSGVGYQAIALHLAKAHGIAVLTPDLRGHGVSGGPPGEAPRVDSHRQDLETILDYALVQVPDVPLLLGAHGASAALALNFMTDSLRKDVRGLLLLAPYLGKTADLHRDLVEPFVTLHKAGLSINKSTFGLLCRSCPGVSLNWPHAARIRYRPLVEDLSAASARAFSVSKPLLQVRSLRVPFGVLVGSRDELLQARETRTFFEQNGREPWLVLNEEIAGSTHLSILVDAQNSAGEWAERTLSELDRQQQALRDQLP